MTLQMGEVNRAGELYSMLGNGSKRESLIEFLPVV